MTQTSTRRRGRKSNPSPLRSFPAWQRREFRAHLIKKYGPVCQLCKLAGKSKQESLIDLDIINQPRSWSIDHIIPMSRGGKNELDNMWPSHKGCNTARGNDNL